MAPMCCHQLKMYDRCTDIVEFRIKFTSWYKNCDIQQQNANPYMHFPLSVFDIYSFLMYLYCKDITQLCFQLVVSHPRQMLFRYNKMYHCVPQPCLSYPSVTEALIFELFITNMENYDTETVVAPETPNSFFLMMYLSICLYNSCNQLNQTRIHSRFCALHNLNNDMTTISRSH